MPSDIVSASIPEDLRPLWDRLGRLHHGSSKFVQWVLATLAEVEDEPLDAQRRALQHAALEARAAFLEAQLATHRAELASLRDRLAGAAPAIPEAELSAQDWLKQVRSKLGDDWLSGASERQVHALAARMGAEPRACWALVEERRAAGKPLPLRRTQASDN